MEGSHECFPGKQQPGWPKHDNEVKTVPGD